MKVFALYLYRSGMTVNRSSRVGRATAKLPTRRATCSATRTAIVGASASAGKTKDGFRSGNKASVKATPTTFEDAAGQENL